MSALGDTLRSLAAVLDAKGLEWFLFGAQAVALRGAPRATQDVDVTVAVPPDELSALATALDAAGLHHRYPEQAEELLETAAVLPLIHDSEMEVDLVVAGSGLERLALSRASQIDVEGIAVPVASATDLVVMKVLAGRGKDLDDVRALQAGGDVDDNEVRNLLGQLESALGVSDLLPTYETTLKKR